MIEHKYIGFIVNKVNYKDNDAIFNVISKDSYETFKAKGILKVTSKNATSCNYFMISEFITYSKSENSNQTLKQSSIIKMYKKPYEDILVSAAYLFICSILNQIKEQINGYNEAIKCFDMLENNYYPLDVLNYFMKNVCDALGYMPNISGCINCNKKNNLISFDFESGGFICVDCFISNQHNKLQTSFLKDIYIFLKSDDLYLLENNRSKQLFNMYCDFLKEVINLNMQAKEFIINCLQ